MRTLIIYTLSDYIELLARPN